MKLDEMIETIEAMSKECDCGHDHNRITIETMAIGHDAFQKCSAFLQDKGFQRVLMIADQHTDSAAGEKLRKQLEHDQIKVAVCLIEPNQIGDVVADEISIVQALLAINDDIDALLAVGSGTLHDITRFCSAKTGKPFLSIPTAASVDGFTSLGAPLIVKGVKQTFQTVSPIALFADIDVLVTAPKKMTAAGFGDMLAKFTSLADWRFGHLMKGEAYCPLAADLTKQALQDCVDKLDLIAAGEEEGLESLLSALIQSGLAMLLFGHSHPASGGEHHLSHYWEMNFLQNQRKQVLHGAKVGVSSVMLSSLYPQWFKMGELLSETTIDRKQQVEEIIQSIPESTTLASYLKKLGGPTTPEELEVQEELVAASLKEAHLLRERFTMLKCYNIHQ